MDMDSIRVGACFLLALLVGALGACSSGPPLTDHNPDPRALPGTAPTLKLDNVLADHRLGLPKAASEVKFKSRRDNDPYWLELAFSVDCAQGSAFFKKEGLERQEDDGDLYDEARVEEAARSFGMESNRYSVRGTYVKAPDEFRNSQMGVLLADADKCQVVILSDRYN
ncbi:hypothetical protein ACFFV7_11160 [Nonomuraea spiralis]|uniref:Lipoprotein n=1 Tax=Nonomuraea spiralis TaxID=46182 RepID=A0ABV5IB35_9ACTN|nr:hypothetical protein [Nonomuraea spiralis]GGS81459.1 hypothetical protein GCM10010176_026310 [Nonomuraea spiralis]